MGLVVVVVVVVVGVVVDDDDDDDVVLIVSFTSSVFFKEKFSYWTNRSVSASFFISGCAMQYRPAIQQNGRTARLLGRYSRALIEIDTAAMHDSARS